MKATRTLLTCGLAASLVVSLRAAQAFPDPADGWTYLYNGDQLQTGEPALDGTWTHDNGSDAFAGDEIGGVLDPLTNPDNRPGGAMILTEGDTTFLRMQDTGDPRDYDGDTGAWNDPSNRKIYFGHYLFQDLPEADTLAILDEGVTLTFRARIPTPGKATGPLDPLHRDGQNTSDPYPDNGVVPYPEGGDGYLTSDGAKGNFVIRQIGDGTPEHPGGAIALSLTVPDDTPGGNPNSGRAGFAGLTMNERSGPVPSGNVDFGEGSGVNNFPLDPTDWHEFWIAIRKTRNPDKAQATHDVFVWRDGNLVATAHKVTAGTGSDLNAGSFIATGGSATPQNWALDVDWFGYKKGFVLPEGGQVPPDVIVTPAGGTLNYDAAQGLSIDVEANMPGSTIPNSGFEVILNGQDITGQLTISGSDADPIRTATFNGLAPNQVYTAVVRVTDSTGLTTEVVSDFDTFVEGTGLVIESEDYNFYGLFFDDPAPGSYQDAAGGTDIDWSDTTPDTASAYRPLDGVDMDDNNDVARQKFVDAQVPDYQVVGVESGEWLNYTRTFPSKVLTPYLRAGAGADRLLRLDLVTSDPAQPNQTTKPLGLFVARQTRTVNTYKYIPLTDAFGVPRSLNLAGQTAVRLTAVDVQNDVNHNFLLFADAGASATTLPWAISVSPTPDAQAVPVDATIAVSLVDGQNALDPASIQMKFDGQDVTASLTVVDTPEGADVTYDPAGLTEGSTHTVELTYADTTGATDTRTWSFKVEGEAPAGARIAWVSFHPADDTPSDAAAAAGFTEAPDAAYTRLLAQHGYQVTRIVTSATPDPELLKTFDLVIVSRSVPSNHYQDAGATAWNSIETPMMILGGYVLRSSRMGFTTGTTMVDTVGPARLQVLDPGHPIFHGVPLDANHVTVNPYTDVVTFNGQVQRGVSINMNPLVPGGIPLARIAAEGDPANGGVAVAEFWPGTVMADGTHDVLAGHRLVFLTGSREASGLTSEGAGIFDMVGDGEQLLLNAVAYMLIPKTKMSIALQDGNVVISWEPAIGTLQKSTDLKTWTPVEGAASPVTIPLDASPAFYRVR